MRLDPEQLAARKLAAAEVVDAIRKNNVVKSAGLVEANHELYLSLVTGQARRDRRALEDCGARRHRAASRSLSASSGRSRPPTPSPTSARRRTAGRRCSSTSSDSLPRARSRSRAGRRALPTRPELLPKDVRWTTFYDQAEFVRDSVHGVRDAILIGVGPRRRRALPLSPQRPDHADRGRDDPRDGRDRLARADLRPGRRSTS